LWVISSGEDGIVDQVMGAFKLLKLSIQASEELRAVTGVGKEALFMMFGKRKWHGS